MQSLVPWGIHLVISVSRLAVIVLYSRQEDKERVREREKKEGGEREREKRKKEGVRKKEREREG